MRDAQVVWNLLARMPGERPKLFRDRIHLNTFFPPYPSEAFARLCKLLSDGQRKPFSTFLAVTPACPFRCDHCSHARRGNSQMPLELILDLIAQMKDLGVCMLGLTGGEPLLRQDLERMISAAGPELATIVATTGWGLDEARAASLAAAGVTYVALGIESAEPERHDRFRGRGGSFEQVRQGVKACQSAGIYVALTTVARRERLTGGELERMYALAEQWGAQEFRVFAPVATGAMVGCAREMLEPQELSQLEQFHVSHNQRGAGPTVLCFSRVESPEQFGCGAGYNHMFIDAAGNVCPCDLTPLSFGNVREKPLAEIWSLMGRHFCLPRRRCVMGLCAHKLRPGQDLPVPPEQTTEILPPRDDQEPLPDLYRQILEAGRQGLPCAEPQAQADRPAGLQ